MSSAALAILALAIGGASLLALAGLPLYATWRAARSRDEGDRDTFDLLVAIYGACAFVVVVVVGALLCMPALPFSIVFLFVGLYIGLMTIFERYLTQRMVFVRALAAAAERQIPLAPLVRAMARESGVIYRARLRSLARRLESGDSLVDAVQSVRGILPDAAVVAIVTGTLTSRLGPPLREVSDAHERQRPAWRGVSLAAVYLLSLLAVGMVIVQFFVRFIVPRMYEVVQDFGLPEQVPLRLLADLSGSVWILLASLLVTLALFALLIVALLLSLGVFRAPLWPFDLLWRRIDAAVILRSLAATAEAQQPFAPLFESLASGYPSSWVRRRLASCAQQVQSGVDWCAALRTQGLIGEADAAVIHAAQRVGNLPWVLRELAASGERRLVYRLSAVGQILMPLAIVACGAVVLMVVVACFLPLVNVILEMVP